MRYLLTLAMLFILCFLGKAIAFECSSTECYIAHFGSPPNYGDGETDDIRLSAAILASKKTAHHIVRLPEGKIVLARSIIVSDEVSQLRIIGAGSGKTTIHLLDAVNSQSAFDIARSPNFSEVDVEIRGLTINMSRRSAGHGIRVGAGWRRGQLTIRDVEILNAPAYGIGIQNWKQHHLSADNINISRVKIFNSGSDAIDTKSPPAGNKNLIISDVIISEYGLRDERSSAGVDISYSNFSLKNVKISAASCLTTEQAVRFCERAENKSTSQCGSNPRSCNVGIRFRQRDKISSSNGVIENVDITGTTFPFFFAGKTVQNENIAIRSFSVTGYTDGPAYLRGRNHVIQDGCIGPTTSRNGSSLQFGKPIDRDSIVIRNVRFEPVCAQQFSGTGSP